MSLLERLMSKVVWNGGEDECMIWEGGKNSDGYGYIRVGPCMVRVHRLAYELFVGPIPDDHDLDHVKARGCTSRACCNPEHLEPVTNAENLRRGDTLAAANAAKTHCPQGHPYSGDNLVVVKGSRTCRECDRTRSREYQQRKRLQTV